MKFRATSWVANTAWSWVSRRAHREFRAALANPERAQTSILRGILRANAASEYGRKYDFERIEDVAAFRDRVPFTTYDELRPWVERVARGEAGVLTEEPVRLLEPSSGSTTAAKLIPYTAGLQREIRAAVAPWICDLYASRPSLKAGPAYWCVTPTESFASSLETEIPVGFEEDSAYLGGAFQALVNAVLAVPSSVRRIHDIEEFRRTTLDYLVRCRELRLLSVWHPSFLDFLFEPLRDRDLRELWPRLRLVSCWGDGNASLHAARVLQRLPGVEVQPKGLIATEGIVSIPFAEHHPLAITSHYLEFLDDEGRAWGAWELERGARYSVTLTTSGGLYRYRLNDRVEVTGFLDRTPCVRFLGKEDHIVDLRGEKLSDGFVATAIQRALSKVPGKVHFALVAPRRVEATPQYVLYLESDGVIGEIADRLEAELRRNPHYAHCRELGQLAACEVALTPSGAYARYTERLRREGRRLGSIKPAALSSLAGWDEIFEVPPLRVPG